MVKIQSQVRDLIIKKMMNGAKQVQVARDLNLGQTTVRYIWLKYLKTGEVNDSRRSGRPMKSTPRQRRLLSIISKRHPFWTARELGNESKILQNVSLCTVKRYLCNNNLYGRVASKKPLLNNIQIGKRIKWCKAYSAWTSADWSKVIFSDECRVERHCNRRKFVRRPINQRFHSRYVTKTVKYGGYSVLVWGFIKADGNRMLIRCPQILNSAGYQSVLSQGLLDMYNSDDIFMQDGAPCHRSMSTSQYLDSNNICVISDWPPQSPDLNIIEHMWCLVKEKVAKRHPKNAEELWYTIKEEWDGIPNEAISRLYKSIPKRLQLTLRNRGLHSHY